MSGIFTSKNLTVSFRRFEQDIVERGRGRLLSQFYRSEVLKQLLDCVSIEVQELYDALLETLKNRTLDKATGEALDIIGILVGAKKTLYNYADIEWFASDKEDRFLDNNPVWTTNAAIAGDLDAPEPVWRRLIIAKIFKNHCKFASTPEIRYFIKLLVDSNMSFMRIGAEEVQIVIKNGTSFQDVRMLAKVFKNTEIDNYYLMPIPPDVNINEHKILIVDYDEDNQLCSFAPDRDPYGKTDFAKVTMAIQI